MAKPKAPMHLQKEEKSEFDRISDRLVAAIDELNSALKEAHECAEMRVFLGITGDGCDEARQYQYHIYRLSRSVITMAIKVAEPLWKQVKDPRFYQAAGRGLSAIRSK